MRKEPKAPPECPHCKDDLVIVPVCSQCLNRVEGIKLETMILVVGGILLLGFIFGTLTIFLK